MFKLTPKQKFVGENLKGKTSLRGPQKEGSEPWESLMERGPKKFTSDLLKLLKDPKVSKQNYRGARRDEIPR